MRIYGWMILLRTRGMLNDALLWRGLTEKRIKYFNNSGAGSGREPYQAFATVDLPLTLPGIMSGAMLVFVPAVGMFFFSI